MGHRETLGVSSNADSDEIKRAYRKLAKEAHPDHSKSPGAAEAFKRIKEAHDALMNKEVPVVDADTIQKATATAAKATAAAAFTPPPPPTMTDEELERIQDLDRQAAKKSMLSFFKRKKESFELRRHRHRIKTNTRRLDGKY